MEEIIYVIIPQGEHFSIKSNPETGETTLELPRRLLGSCVTVLFLKFLTDTTVSMFDIRRMVGLYDNTYEITYLARNNYQVIYRNPNAANSTERAFRNGYHGEVEVRRV